MRGGGEELQGGWGAGVQDNESCGLGLAPHPWGEPGPWGPKEASGVQWGESTAVWIPHPIFILRTLTAKTNMRFQLTSHQP